MPITGLDLLEAKLDSIPFLNNDQDERMELTNEQEKGQGNNSGVSASAITDGNSSSQANVIDTVQHNSEPSPSVTEAPVPQVQEECGKHLVFSFENGSRVDFVDSCR